MREREMHNCFYTGSLNHRSTSSLPGKPEPGFHYIQKFYKSHTKITLLNKETHKIFDSHKHLDTHPARITLTNLKSHQANQPEAQEHQNLMVAVPSQPYMCSSSNSQAKMPPKPIKINQDLQETSCNYVLQREIFREKNDKVLCTKTKIRVSHSIEFFIQSADFT